MKQQKLQCPRRQCQHEWEPRVKAPVKCPRCQNPLPRKPKKGK